jgi:hypothetical protein
MFTGGSSSAGSTPSQRRICMVRRGSAVRVRQRDLQSARQQALSRSGRRQIGERASGMEPFMELSVRRGTEAGARSLNHRMRLFPSGIVTLQISMPTAIGARASCSGSPRPGSGASFAPCGPPTRDCGCDIERIEPFSVPRSGPVLDEPARAWPRSASGARDNDAVLVGEHDGLHPVA